MFGCGLSLASEIGYCLSAILGRLGSPAGPFGCPRQPEGEDIVDFWRRRLPLVVCMEGKPKGRSIRAIREVAKRLAQRERTITDSQVLYRYEALCKLAAKAHPRHLEFITYDDAKAVLAMLTDEQSPIPPRLIVTVLEKRAAIVSKGGNLKLYIDILNPWTPVGGGLDPAKSRTALGRRRYGWTCSSASWSSRPSCA